MYIFKKRWKFNKQQWLVRDRIKPNQTKLYQLTHKLYKPLRTFSIM